MQQYISPWNEFLHITKTMFLYIFLRFSTVSDIGSDHPNILNVVERVILQEMHAPAARYL